MGVICDIMRGGSSRNSEKNADVFSPVDASIGSITRTGDADITNRRPLVSEMISFI